MASFNITSPTTIARSLSGTEVGVVGRFGAIQTISGPPVMMADNASLLVEGAISTIGNNAINGGDIVNGSLLISQTGSVTAARNAVFLPNVIFMGNALRIDFTNAGQVTGNAIGASLSLGAMGVDLEVVNSGTMASWSTGYALLASLSGRIQFTNSGLVESAESGLFFNGNLDDRTQIENSGTISGVNFSIEGFTSGADVTNSGTLNGDVRLGSSNDLFNSRYGTVNGQITMQGGDDTVRGSVLGDDVLAGADDDFVMGFNGDDTILGEAGSDTIYGNAGDDVINGGGKSDRLTGGKGNDTMTGGGGSDTFVFRRVANGDDEITDFQNGSDVIDLSALGLQNFNALKNGANALSNDTDAVVIDLAAAGGSGSVRVIGVQVADMDAGDFIF